MKTVILCGGLGTRLREETEFRPKPMVEIGGRPILWHIMKIYSHYGFREFVLCLGYRGNMIKEYFLNYEAMNNDCTICLGDKSNIAYHGAHGEQGFRITLADTGQETMTGGRLKQVAKYIDGDTFMMTYGDGVADVDLAKLLEFHQRQGKLATVTAVRPMSRFGQLTVNDEGRVSSFAEKAVVEGWISAGFMVLDRRVLDYVDGDEVIFERGPMERLVGAGQMAAFRHEGVFYPVDTYREYKALNEIWAGGNAPWKVWKD